MEQTFSIEFYETQAGRCPVREFLDDIKRVQPELHARLLAGIQKLQDRHNHREPLCKDVGDDLYELRCLGQESTRVLWAYFPGRRIVLLHALIKRTKKLPKKDRRTALERWRELTGMRR